MSYRCSACDRVQPPGQRLRRHTVRKGGQIVREYPVCVHCQDQMAAGVSLAAIRARFGVRPKTAHPGYPVRNGPLPPAAVRTVAPPAPLTPPTVRVPSELSGRPVVRPSTKPKE